MTQALRWAAMRAILMFDNCEGQSHETVPTDHNFWRERRAEADSYRSPFAYQPNALPLGHTGSHFTQLLSSGFYLLPLSRLFRQVTPSVFRSQRERERQTDRHRQTDRQRQRPRKVREREREEEEEEEELITQGLRFNHESTFLLICPSWQTQQHSIRQTRIQINMAKWKTTKKQNKEITVSNFTTLYKQSNNKAKSDKFKTDIFRRERDRENYKIILTNEVKWQNTLSLYIYIYI